MQSFQRNLIILSFVLLIAILILVAISLYKNNSSQVWPPVIGDCPDYWIDMSGNGSKCVNVQKLGTCESKTMNFSISPYTGSNGLCQKYNWASNCGLTWDGITSGVINPCDPSGNIV